MVPFSRRLAWARLFTAPVLVRFSGTVRHQWWRSVVRSAAIEIGVLADSNEIIALVPLTGDWRTCATTISVPIVARVVSASVRRANWQGTVHYPNFKRTRLDLAAEDPTPRGADHLGARAGKRHSTVDRTVQSALTSK